MKKGASEREIEKHRQERAFYDMSGEKNVYEYINAGYKCRGKITDERYETMSEAYEEEQKNVKGRIKEIQERFAHTSADNENLTKFISAVRQYTELTELTPELLHSLVDRIYIGEKYELNGKTVQEVKIVYNFVGTIE